MKNKFFLISLALFFLLIMRAYLLNLYAYAISCDGYIVGEWLINFKAGFVRRGLSGSMLLSLADWLSLKPNLTVMGFQLIFFIGYMLLLFILLSRKQPGLFFTLMLLSPATLLFSLLDPLAVGRKEIILFFVFAIYIICLDKNLMRSNAMVILLCLLLVIATLFHELVFFYLPYFLFAAYVKAKSDGTSFNFAKPLILISGALLVMIPLYISGMVINSSAICNNLMEKGLPESICDGPLKYKPQDYDIQYTIAHVLRYHYISFYLPVLGLALVPFFLFIRFYLQTAVSVKQFLVAFLLLFIFSIPLFLAGKDWGRWINIHLMMLLFTCTLLLKDRRSGDPYAEDVHALRIWKSESASAALFNRGIITALCIAYILLWSMPHWRGGAGYASNYSMFDNSVWGHITKDFKLSP